MYSGVARLTALVYVTVLIAACDESRPLAPDLAEPSLAADGGLGAPSSLSSTAVSQSQVNLTWTDNSNETSFQAYRSTTGPGGSFTLLATMGANATNHSDMGLTALTEYCYRVRAVRTTGGRTKY